MKKKNKMKWLSLGICVLFISTVLSVPTDKEGNEGVGTWNVDGATSSGETLGKGVILDGQQSAYHTWDSILTKDYNKNPSTYDPLSVEITSPPNGATVKSRYLTVLGYADTVAEEKIVGWQWSWIWEDGRYDDPYEAISPCDYLEFRIDIEGLYLGDNTVTVTVRNSVASEASDSVTVTYVDEGPPSIDITSPPDGSEFSTPYINVDMYADDGWGTPQWGSGVKKISWTHTWEGGEESDSYIFDQAYDYVTLSVPITLRQGENTIAAWAEDLAGNPSYSDQITVNYIVPEDHTPPTTTKVIGEPQYEEGYYVTSETSFTLLADDGPYGSGVAGILHRIWYNGDWNSWVNYSDSFTLNGEGLHYLEYYAVDNEENAEEVHNQTHIVDDTGPDTFLYKNESKECPKKYALICCGTTKDSQGKGVHDEWVHAALFAYFALIQEGYKAQDIVFVLWHENIPKNTINDWLKALKGCPGWIINGVQLPNPINKKELTDQKIKDMWEKSINDFTHDKVGQGKQFARGKDMLLKGIEKLKEKIKDEDKDKVEVTIYLTDHGFEWKDMGEHYFSFDDSFDQNLKTVGEIWDHRLSSEELADSLSKIECKKMLIYLDFCYSGGFINKLKNMDKNGKERVIVTATDAATTGLFGSNSGSRFFTPFWNNLKNGKKIKNAYDDAKNTCTQLCGGRDQKPQIEYYPDEKKAALEQYNQFQNESVNDESSMNIIPGYDEAVGVDNIFYRIDEGSWLGYISPFSIQYEGLHTLDFYAVDYLGNTGSITCHNIYVDTTPPEIPDLTSPFNGESTCNVPYFDWESVTDSSDVYYTLQVASDEDFSDIIFEVDDIVGSEYIAHEDEAFSLGVYYWRVRASDGVDNSGQWSEAWNLNVETVNSPPAKPSKPTGPVRGKTEEKYSFSSQTMDSEGDMVSYCFDWGDGIFDWTSWTESGETVSASHIWYNKGDYSIRVKVVDAHGAESEWSDPLSITMPKIGHLNIWSILGKLNRWFVSMLGKELVSEIFDL